MKKLLICKLTAIAGLIGAGTIVIVSIVRAIPYTGTKGESYSPFNHFISELGPQRLILPFPTVMVVTGNMEKANIVTIARISMLSGNPLTLGISVG